MTNPRAPGAHGSRLGAAALLLSASVLMSRLLGYVREAVLAWRVGAGAEVDAYRAGFQIPDLLNYFLAGGALSVAFVPLYTRARARGQDEAARLYGTVLGTLGVTVLLATVVLWWQAEALVALQFPRFDEAKRALTVHLTRIVLPAQIFFVTGGIVRAALMAEGRFRAQAAAPVIYNGAIIAGGLFLAPWLGVEGFAWGALVGALLGPFLVGWAEARGRLPVQIRVAPFDPEFGRYLVVAAPLMLGLSLLVVDEWYERWFGGLLGDGVVAQLGYARQIMLVPVAVVGQALAAAALPFLSRLWTEGRGDELAALVLRTLRMGIALAVFAGAELVAVAHPAVVVLYQRGRFSAQDTHEVAAILAVLGLACPAWVAQQIASRAFYARSDTWRPMLLATVVALAMVPVYLVLGERVGATGIAWAGVIGISVNACATLLLARRLHGAPALAPLGTTVLRSVGIGAVAAFAATQVAIGGSGLPGALVDLMVRGAVCAAVMGAGLWLVGDTAMRDAARVVLRRLGRGAPHA